MSSLRLAVSEDLPRVREIVEAAYSPYIPRMGQPPQPMLDDYRARLSAGELQVLEENGSVIGLLVLIDRLDSLLIDNVAVDPAAKGKGHGRTLLAAAEAIAAARGFSRLTLYTHITMTENQAIYRRYGWREIKRIRENGFERVYFTKDLEI
ncbi:MAG: GNAT family N-acetyltransferase [Kiloniellales bacterium]